MTTDEAKKIFRSWQDFVEIADKFFRLFLPIPNSFLPYPKETLVEGLNIVSKYCFDSGDKKLATLIQDTMHSYLPRCEEDEKALEGIKDRLNMVFGNPDLKKTLIENLHKGRDHWIHTREQKE